MNQTVAEAVAHAIRTVLHDSGRDTPAIVPDTVLASGLGLDSLDLAQTIVLLERSLGVDPFRAASPGGARAPVRTVSDLVSIYTSALADHP